MTRVISLALGLLLLAATFHGLVATLVVPRRAADRVASSRLASTLWHIVAWGFTATLRLRSSRRAHSGGVVRRFEREDRVLGLLGPVSLLALFGTWVVLVFAGFTLVIAGLNGDGDLGSSLALAGSSILTLGVRSPAGTAETVAAYAAAAAGLVVIALEIGYLPTIYSHYNRRESAMRRLEARAGEPAWGPELLVRQHHVDSLSGLGTFYLDWEGWSAETLETHLTYPWLLLFRSADPWQSWIVSQLAVLDAAALHLALCPTTAPAPQARQCLRMGFTAVRRLALLLDLPFDPDPMPDHPLELTRTEFDEAVAYLQAAGVPLERAAAEAWPHFAGWRVNYEQAAYGLARVLRAPPAMWTGLGHRVAPRQPRHRSPDDPEGAKVKAIADSQDWSGERIA